MCVRFGFAFIEKKKKHGKDIRVGCYKPRQHIIECASACVTDRPFLTISGGAGTTVNDTARCFSPIVVVVILRINRRHRKEKKKKERERG